MAYEVLTDSEINTLLDKLSDDGEEYKTKYILVYINEEEIEPVNDRKVFFDSLKEVKEYMLYQFIDEELEHMSILEIQYKEIKKYKPKPDIVFEEQC